MTKSYISRPWFLYSSLNSSPAASVSIPRCMRHQTSSIMSTRWHALKTRAHEHLPNPHRSEHCHDTETTQPQPLSCWHICVSRSHFVSLAYKHRDRLAWWRLVGTFDVGDFSLYNFDFGTGWCGVTVECNALVSQDHIALLLCDSSPTLDICAQQMYFLHINISFVCKLEQWYMIH